ncbi:MAG: DUF255 domain-containing protein [Aminobacterium sp.]|jgi:hypothetical protein|uniref:DUF255 domain-containing protein n=1 Tax=Aminobacterium sp. TaxID=1872491 RepID=UPI001BD064F1|nr:DUF255 domain-containing protein [Aminobacterium sp.]MDD2206116.1 DUF255 domain-containing protein [Aminobacterium sp.]MDD3426307.1 DUF255 domain-containing protein [Aminobacterium sp.]MDD3707835.1 DUF255 domain-containing protein [Aminobacterium sp.]MDD4228040.1 DUF255 domain-containing protein [Aminobacterium sp.]MDD4551113.1 DUF255 domain-containing protein [Aminobacterium sp.]
MSIDEKKAARWEEFREQTLEIAARRNSPEFDAYIGSLTERAWKHVISEGKLDTQNAEATMWKFFCEDQKNR